MARRHAQIDAEVQGRGLALVDTAVLVGIRDRMRPEVWTGLVQTAASDLRRFSAVVCSFQYDRARDRLQFAASGLRDLAVSFGAPQLAWQAGKLEKEASEQLADRLLEMAAQVGNCARSTALALAELHLIERPRLLSNFHEGI